MLSAAMAVAYVAGLQGGGVAACVKHLVANDTEARPLRDLLRARRAHAARGVAAARSSTRCARAGGWSTMAAYNRLHGTHCSRERAAAHHHPARRVGLGRRGDLRLVRHPQHRRLRARRPRPRDARAGAALGRRPRRRPSSAARCRGRRSSAKRERLRLLAGAPAPTQQPPGPDGAGGQCRRDRGGPRSGRGGRGAPAQRVGRRARPPCRSPATLGRHRRRRPPRRPRGDPGRRAARGSRPPTSPPSPTACARCSATRSSSSRAAGPAAARRRSKAGPCVGPTAPSASTSRSSTATARSATTCARATSGPCSSTIPTPAEAIAGWTVRASATFTPTTSGPHRFRLKTADEAELYVDGEPVGEVADLEAGRVGAARGARPGAPTRRPGSSVELRWRRPSRPTPSSGPWRGRGAPTPPWSWSASTTTGRPRAATATTSTCPAARSSSSGPSPPCSRARSSPSSPARPSTCPGPTTCPRCCGAGTPARRAATAIADVLTGAADPGGRLPCTMPRRLEDTPALPRHAARPGRAALPGGRLLRAPLVRRPRRSSRPSPSATA